MSTKSQTTSFATRAAIFVLKSFIFLMIPLVVLELAIWVRPSLMAVSLAAIDTQIMCRLENVLSGTEKHEKFFEDAQMIVSNSTLEAKGVDGLNLWKTPHGSWWFPNGSDQSALTILAQQVNRIYGEGEWGVQEGDIVLDAGAHVGTFVRTALDDGAAVVVAIEPAPVNLAALHKNFSKEIEEGRVIVAPVGVWDMEDVLPLYEDPHNSGADSFVTQGPNDVVTATIPLTTIDLLMENYNLPRVDMIKMDIKGATQKAIRGAAHVLQQHRPRLAISTEELEDDPELIRDEILALQADYSVRCGVCSVYEYKVQPDVLHFR